jgi:hypothetical protein
MSDQAIDFSCSNCREAPGMTLLGQNRTGQPVTGEQIRIVERFVEE